MTSIIMQTQREGNGIYDCLLGRSQAGGIVINTSTLCMGQEKKNGELKTYCWTLLGQHIAMVAFGSDVSIAIVDGSLRTCAVADGDVDSLRGTRGEYDIGVIAGISDGVGDEVKVDGHCVALQVHQGLWSLAAVPLPLRLMRCPVAARYYWCCTC